ncbi:sulfide:quinone oxidoreductase [Catalinimonas alkaloidigena]|uniref:NAD(P)/FAD-dependent oxidoreductase n=1 Tax=Catalinimonas alkaloidigena TaxID=1075417 RepID=UPI002405C7C3|nr:FAD/NAD(P)-binding oxidoreductase [Catalinimonas alkaloidigena]MDF9797564.1 sulfide:quinone oxidoreductase [Catalinimonas alkaloidigena]
MSHYQILIVGGGNAGISVASQLLLKDQNLNIGIIEPSEKHYYQPAWTLVGGGDYDVKDTEKTEAEVMPEEVSWLKEAADTFKPENNSVTTAEGNTYTYDYLVVCPGIQLDWHKVEGLKESLGKNGVCSNYGFDKAPYTWDCVRNFKVGGTALFTQPSTPVKCGGAPQKIMYMASDHFQRRGILSKSKVEFFSPGSVIFGVKKYAKVLQEVVDNYGIHLNFKHDLIKIDGPNHQAIFKVTDKDGNVSEEIRTFDMIHVTPPQSAPDFIKQSPLANEAGWLDLDKYTLQHTKYPNIFGLGDASGTPNAKTGAAVRKQAPVLVENLLAVMTNKSPQANYSGYGSCPLVTGKGRLVLAEFDYNNEPMESFPFDQAKERFSMYQLKRYVLPWLYWNKILKGTA